MSDSNSIMAAAMASQSVASIGNAYAQSQAARMKGNFESKMFELNRKIAEVQAGDALARGERDAATVKKSTKQLIGTQRAALAASGVEVNADSALAIQEDTAMLGALDALTVKNNAFREAWGYKVQALSYGSQASFAALSGQTDARNTLLTGGLNSLNYGLQSAYYYKGGKGPTVPGGG